MMTTTTTMMMMMINDDDDDVVPAFSTVIIGPMYYPKKADQPAALLGATNTVHQVLVR